MDHMTLQFDQSFLNVHLVSNRMKIKKINLIKNINRNSIEIIELVTICLRKAQNTQIPNYTG